MNILQQFEDLFEDLMARDPQARLAFTAAHRLANPVRGRPLNGCGIGQDLLLSAYWGGPYSTDILDDYTGPSMPSLPALREREFRRTDVLRCLLHFPETRALVRGTFLSSVESHGIRVDKLFRSSQKFVVEAEDTDGNPLGPRAVNILGLMKSTTGPNGGLVVPASEDMGTGFGFVSVMRLDPAPGPVMESFPAWPGSHDQLNSTRLNSLYDQVVRGGFPTQAVGSTTDRTPARRVGPLRGYATGVAGMELRETYVVPAQAPASEEVAPPTEELPTEVGQPQWWYVQRPYGEEPVRTSNNLDDASVRRANHIEVLYDGTYAGSYDVERGIEIKADGTTREVNFLYGDDGSGLVFLNGLLRRFVGVSEPPEGWHVTHHNNAEVWYPPSSTMEQVWSFTERRSISVPYADLSCYPRTYTVVVHEGGYYQRARRPGSLPSGYIYQDNQYYASRRCPRCAVDHPAYNFDSECLSYRRQSTMEVVQNYHGSSNLQVFHGGATPYSDYTVGFEVEKNRVVNLDGSEAYDRGHYVDRTPLFSRWERDGSCGVEGITHAYSLGKYQLFRSHVMASRHLLEGNVSDLRSSEGREEDARRRFNCGGHITLNGPRVSMDNVRHYAGLIYALYKKRLRNNFCEQNKNMQGSGRDMHYCAIRERGRGSIEFRLVRRVESHTNLLWRFRFFRKLAKAIHTNMSFEAYLRENRPLLNEVYNRNKVRDVLADARHFNEYLNTGVIHSRISEYI